MTSNPAKAQGPRGQRPVTPLTHPGPRDELRRESVPTASSRVHAVLTPGARLVDALAEVVDRTGCTSAQVELIGGTFDRVSFCVPAVCTDGSTAATYSATREASTPAQLVAASVTVGHRGGSRFTHSHAAWLDANGELRAGHLWPETTVGAVPVYAVVHTLPGVDLVHREDQETRMPTFTPLRATTSSKEEPGARRAVVSRVKAGEEITEAAVEVCRVNGFERAVVRASLGSLVGATLRHADRVASVEGPATEVVTLTGTLKHSESNSYDGELSAVLVDRYAMVHAGPLLRGHNLVAVTFELFITEEHGDSANV